MAGSVQLGLSALCEENFLRKSLIILDDTSHICSTQDLNCSLQADDI